MTNFTAAEAKLLYRQDAVIQSLAKRYGAGFYRFLENFDAETGVLNATISASGLAGTTAGTFTVNSGAETPSIAISAGASTGDFTQTWLVPTLAGDRTITFPAVTATLATIAGTETLTNKTLTSPTMTLPAIGDGLTASGSVSNNFGSSTGAFVTSSGANTLSGNVTISGSKTFTTGTGAVILNGDVTVKGDIDALAAGAAMTVGAANATSLALGAADITTTIAGACALTGAPTVTGTATFNGNVSLESTLYIKGAVTAPSGNPTFSLVASSGAFTTSTGTNTLSGNVVISGSKTLTTGTGIVTLNGATVFAADKGVTVNAGTSAFDFSGGTGIFKTSTGIVTIGAAPSIAGTAAGPAVAITGGAGGGTSGTGGAVTVLGGAGTAGDANGGAVIIRGGAKNGSGAHGAVTIGDSNTASITLGVMPRIPTATKAANLAIQATATALAEGFNLVTCADASNVAVLLPVPVAGMQVIVKNGSAQTAKVFPSSGKVINALAGDASYDMATVKAAMFIAYDTTTWYTLPLAAS